MPITNIQTQSQSMEMQQRLTARQVALMRMLEMPIETLRNRIEEEMIENPALERVDDSENADSIDSNEPTDGTDGTSTADEAASHENELLDQDSIDEMEYFESERTPKAYSYSDPDNEQQYDNPDTPDFRETLMRQVDEYSLSDHQRTLLEYLIGSLDDNGLLKKKLYVIADELEVYNHITTTTDELAQVLAILQQFDPPGIGAQSLQQTLVLQIDSRIAHKPESKLWPLLRRVVTERWDELANNRWDHIRRRLKMNDGELRALQRMLRTLTPSPGCPPGEAISNRHSENAIIADFIVDVSDDGNITIQLNEPGIPTLRINPRFGTTEAEKAGQTANERREARQYAQTRITRANAFIQNIRSRRETLLRVMREVTLRQRDYFLTGDESRIHFLMMKDLAASTGIDISIVSRVAGSKWVETPYGTRPLRWFFRSTGGVKTDDGETLEQDRIKRAIADEIAREDKRRPLTDAAITAIIEAKGFPVARRTVAKYREQLGIPIARMRQQR